MTSMNLGRILPEPPPPPRLEGHRFSLVPLMPSHYHALYELSVNEIASFRWRYHGGIPPYQVFEQTLYHNVLVQFAIVSRQDPTQLAGLAVAYNASFQDGHTYVAAVSDRRLGVGTLEGIVLLLGYVFAQWPFRKVYIEAPEFNLGQFNSAIESGLLKEEGRLLGDRYYSDQYWDLVTFALYRESAEAFVNSTPGLFREPVTTGTGAK
jgi:hypothetical protein